MERWLDLEPPCALRAAQQSTRPAGRLREADDARRRDGQVEVDLVVGGLDGQARDEGDRAW